MDSDPHVSLITYFFWLGELEVHLLSAHSDFTPPLWPDFSELPSITFSEHVWGLESITHSTLTLLLCMVIIC